MLETAHPGGEAHDHRLGLRQLGCEIILPIKVRPKAKEALITPRIWHPHHRVGIQEPQVVALLPADDGVWQDLYCRALLCLCMTLAVTSLWAPPELHKAQGGSMGTCFRGTFNMLLVVSQWVHTCCRCTGFSAGQKLLMGILVCTFQT